MIGSKVLQSNLFIHFFVFFLFLRCVSVLFFILPQLLGFTCGDRPFLFRQIGDDPRCLCELQKMPDDPKMDEEFERSQMLPDGPT